MLVVRDYKGLHHIYNAPPLPECHPHQRAYCNHKQRCNHILPVRLTLVLHCNTSNLSVLPQHLLNSTLLRATYNRSYLDQHYDNTNNLSVLPHHLLNSTLLRATFNRRYLGQHYDNTNNFELRHINTDIRHIQGSCQIILRNFMNLNHPVLNSPNQCSVVLSVGLEPRQTIKMSLWQWKGHLRRIVSILKSYCSIFSYSRLCEGRWIICVQWGRTVTTTSNISKQRTPVDGWRYWRKGSITNGGATFI